MSRLCRISMLLLVLCAALAVINAGAEEKALFAAPNGSDKNPGTEEKPFATMRMAQIMAREIAKRVSCDIAVVLRGGTYRLEETLEFGTEDGGRAGHSVTYRAYPGETPVLSGGRLVTGWIPGANGQWQVKVALPEFRQMYVNGKRAVRARGACPEGVERFGALAYIDEDAGHVFPDGSMADWPNQAEIELGYYNSWSHMICKVDRITRDDTGRALFHMKQPWFFLASRKEGVRAETPAYIENAYALLDEPGEWYYDRAAQTLYYLPRDGEDMNNAEAVVPVLETLVRIQGTLDAPVQNLSFENITFADAAWLQPSRIGHPDVQANCIIGDTNLFSRDGFVVGVQNEYLKSPANVVAQAAQGCRFRRCAFTRLGGAGLDIEKGSKDNLVEGCRFYDISGSGVQLGGVGGGDHHPSDPRNIVEGNRIVNNYFHDIGVEYQDSVGIFAGYVRGTLIAHNEIAQMPYSGMSIGWGWGEEDAGGGAYEAVPYRYSTPTPAGDNRIEFNHIHHVMLKRNDGGGIYTLGNQPGSIIQGNHIHDNGPDGPGGIYLDEGSGFIEITANAVYHVPTAMNYNNRAQDRIATCNEHDNAFDILPGDPAFPAAIAGQAGLEAPYRDLLEAAK